MELTKEDLLYLYNQEKWIEGYWGSRNDEWLIRLEEEMVRRNIELIPCYHQGHTYFNKADGYSEDNRVYCSETCYIREKEWHEQRRKDEERWEKERKDKEEWDKKFEKMKKEMEEYKKRKQEEKDKEPKLKTYQLLKEAGMFEIEEQEEK